MSILAICIGGIVLLVMVEEGRRILTVWLDHRTKRLKQEHQTQRIETMSQMNGRFLETMPDWIDRDDPEEVEAWKKARAEVIKTWSTK